MLELLLKVTIISISGALAPGPLTAAIASAGLKKGWKAGIQASLGHTVVELPLVILIALGATTIFKHPRANFIIGILGSGFLLLFGLLTIRDAFLTNLKELAIKDKSPSPIIIGIALTGLNPYFIIWWIGIGTPLIAEAALKAGIFGIILLYLFHIWLDYGWLTLVATFVSLGRVRTKLYRIILLVLGVIIIWFGINLFIKTLPLGAQF